MERKQYLNLCQRFALLPKGMHRQPTVEAPEVRVSYQGRAYWPYKYELGWDDNGQIRHTAILRDIDRHTAHYVPLEKVEKE